MRKNSEKTKGRILAAAEKLFSQQGFDGTSVDKIARAATVNKALIYYHFKNKTALVKALFEQILAEVSARVEAEVVDETAQQQHTLQEKLRIEITLLQRHRRILSILLMETLKTTNKGHLLFRCAEEVVAQERGKHLDRAAGRPNREERRFMLYEFFTGFLPVITFVALQDRWCRYYRCEADELLDDFLEAFEASHLQTHFKP